MKCCEIENEKFTKLNAPLKHFPVKFYLLIFIALDVSKMPCGGILLFNSQCGKCITIFLDVELSCRKSNSRETQTASAKEGKQ